MNQKKIYILLTHTGTYLSRAIRIVTKVDYTHVSIGLDSDFSKLYSFGRKNPKNPMTGGFVEESISSGLYFLNPRIECRLYSLEVPECCYERVKEQIQLFYKNKDIYRYSLLGLFTCAANIPLDRKHAYFCSQFVADVLQKSGINLFDKHPSLVRPADFIYHNKLQLEYKGFIHELSQYIPKTKQNIEIQTCV